MASQSASKPGGTSQHERSTPGVESIDWQDTRQSSQKLLVPARAFLYGSIWVPPTMLAVALTTHSTSPLVFAFASALLASLTFCAYRSTKSVKLCSDVVALDWHQARIQLKHSDTGEGWYRLQRQHALGNWLIVWEVAPWSADVASLHQSQRLALVFEVYGRPDTPVRVCQSFALHLKRML